MLALVGWSVHDNAREERTRAAVTARLIYVMKANSRRMSVEARAAPTSLQKAYDAASAAASDYMEKCKLCAPAVECERDRLVIESGMATGAYNPCER